MKIGLVGSLGYIAGFLINKLSNHEIIKIDKSGDYDYFLDLENSNDFDSNIFNDLDYLIFTAAISSPDLCQREYDKCWNINVIGTGNIIEKALNNNCRIIFFSSDAVYGDNPDLIFDENSITETSLAYGKMKKEIEDRFKDNGNFKAIRLSYVVSKKDKFTSYVLKCKDNNEVCEVYDPFYRNCITVSDVCNVVCWLVDNWQDFKHPFLNICGDELISREDIVKQINDLFNESIDYKVIYPGDEFYLSRPKICQMKSIYLDEYHILDKKTFKEKLIEEFK